MPGRLPVVWTKEVLLKFSEEVKCRKARRGGSGVSSVPLLEVSVATPAAALSTAACPETAFQNIGLELFIS